MSNNARVAGLIFVFLMVTPLPADARGDRGHGMHGVGGHARRDGADGAGDRHHGNDAYAKSAAEEEDRLLNTKLKSICRGC